MTHRFVTSKQPRPGCCRSDSKDQHLKTGYDLSFTARDSVELGGRLFVPDAPRAIVLICATTGVRQQFYWKFAEWLTTKSYGALTFDYRGIGASLNGRSVRESQAKKQDWGQLDMPAALDFLDREFPDLPIHLVGHSAGGQLIGLMPNYDRLDKIVTVGVLGANSYSWHKFERFPSLVMRDVLVTMLQ